MHMRAHIHIKVLTPSSRCCAAYKALERERRLAAGIEQQAVGEKYAI
jgi:hypothetical protein